MSEVDTSAEAVERLASAMEARVIETYGGHGTVLEMADDGCNAAAATLRALLSRAERAEANSAAAFRAVVDAVDRIVERDAARAEAAMLRETLTWVLNDVQAWCDAIAEDGAGWDYWDDYYKSFKWGGIEKARAALAAKEPGHD